MSYHYLRGYGVRARSNWGTGDDLSEYAEGDIVRIPLESEARRDGRIPHGWSQHRELWDTVEKFRVVSVFSIDVGPSWYYRVAPMDGRKTIWDEHSDRLHVIPGKCDFTADWELLTPAKAKLEAPT